MGVRAVKIRILHNFGNYEKGQVFEDWPAGMAEIFISKGLVERMTEAVEVEQADAAVVVEQAEASPKRKKK